MARKNENSPYQRTLRRAEKNMIEFAVQQAGSLRAAAPTLGVSISFLISRAKALGVRGKKSDEGTTEDKEKAPNIEARDREKDSETDDEPPDNVVQLTRPAPPEPPAPLEVEDEAPLPEGA